jgi:(p)ppGpp synthase/HD superfamily hydrolase
MAPAAKLADSVGGSALVRDAYDLLAGEHEGQTQKLNGRPYVEHPVTVAETVSSAGFDDEVVAAALLHDIVEDTELEVAELRERFGPRVAGLVEAMTDDAEVEPYLRRKAVHRERIAEAGTDAAAIYAADKLSNMRGLRSAFAELGGRASEALNQPLEDKLAVWEADAEMLARFGDAIPYREDLADEVAAARAELLSP